MSDESSEGMLAGVKVLDVASFIAAPAATTIMADLGADVIKIEPPGTGDPFRHLRNSPGNPPSDVDYAYLVDNRNKRGLALDLKTAEGRSALYRMAETADVFVTNLPLPARGRLKVAYDDLKPLNERLIYASLTAYGETGPEANNTGFDSTALWARTGLMDMVRPTPDSAPARSLPGMGDHPTAVALFGAIMSALYKRERTGKGSMVSTNLLANGLWSNAIHVQAMLCGAEFKRRPARENATSALHNLYRTSDDRWMHIVVIPEDKRWPVLCEAIGRSDLIADDRFAVKEIRHSNTSALIGILDAVFTTKTLAEWRAILDKAGISYGIVAALTDIPTDVQMQASDALTPIDNPEVPTGLTVNSPVWIDGETKRAPAAPPAIGEHSREVLTDYGFESGEIEAMISAGVVGQA
jgi:crotonobetainyl-CoA:carnitine CoA-transferase CaiB-like acyl-CoA transferase